MFGLVPYKRNDQVRRVENGLWDFDKIVEDFFGEALFPDYYGGGRQMKVDIKENENEFLVDAELPGVDRSDINIAVDNERLTISVNKKEAVEEEKDNYIRRERRQYSMQRSFNIENIDQERIDAKYDNGILTITLPKKEVYKAEKRNIQIN